MIAYALSRFPSTPVEQDKPSPSKDLSRANELFTTRVENPSAYGYRIDLSIAYQEQQQEIRNRNSKCISYMWDRRYGYSQKELNNDDIIYFDKNIYFPFNLRRRVLD